MREVELTKNLYKIINLYDDFVTVGFKKNHTIPVISIPKETITIPQNREDIKNTTDGIVKTKKDVEKKEDLTIKKKSIIKLAEKVKLKITLKKDEM